MLNRVRDKKKSCLRGQKRAGTDFDVPINSQDRDPISFTIIIVLPSKLNKKDRAKHPG
jgi:hypothetical protein